MGRKEPLVVIVLVNYNGESVKFRSKPLLWHSLSSLKGIKYPNYRVLVSDDNSTDGSVEYVKRNFPRVEVVVNRPNGAYAKAANCGIRKALRSYDPDYIVVMDNDVKIKGKDWLAKMVAIAEPDEKIGIVGSKNLFPDGRLQDAGAKKITPIARNRARELSRSQQYDRKMYSGIEDVDFVSSARFLLKRRLIDTIGPYDENLYMGNEDTDYCLNARRAGFRVVYDGELSIVHFAGYTYKSIAGTKKDPDYAFPIVMTNEAYFSFKNYRGLRLVEAIMVIILRSFLRIGTEPQKPANIRFKSRVLWRLGVSLGAISNGYRLYKHQLTRSEAYHLSG